MKLRPWMQRLARLSPLLGFVLNKVAHPGLHCGAFVELPVSGTFSFGPQVRIGALTRIYLGGRGEVALGRGVNIGRDTHLQTDAGCIQIGQGTSIQDHCRLYGNVIVGSGCLFAPNVYVSSGKHVFSHRPELPILLQERLCTSPDQQVCIGDDCWIGVNAVVMPGVVIGKGCVIGAGAVVTRDVPPYSVVVGIPARVVRQRLKFVPPTTVDATRDEDWPYFYAGFDAGDVGGDSRHGLICRNAFTLALRQPGATRLVLSTAAIGEDVDICFESQTVRLGKAPVDVCFVLEGQSPDRTFWPLQVSAPCRLLRAELA